MYKGKYLNTNPAPAAAPADVPEEKTSEQLLEEVLEQDMKVEEAPVPEEEIQKEPAKKPAKKSAKKSKKKKKTSKGTIIFYSIYFVFVIACVVAIVLLMKPLNDWLVSYEASQPETMCQKVFDEHFADPDWSSLYDLAGLEDTTFEGKDAYSTYMEGKVSAATNPELSYQETSAGLSGNHKYNVKLDDEKVACFILQPIKGIGDSVTGWELGSVELFMSREQSVTVERLPGQIVTINGVTLDDSHIIRTTATKAESYLPEGLHGYRSEQLSVTGLLVPPQVSLTNEDGTAVGLVIDEETGIWKAADQGGELQIPEDHLELAKTFGKNYALYAIRKISHQTLAKYMYSKSQCYKDVIYTAPFLQKFVDYQVNDVVVADYYAYSEDFFSARIQLSMDVHAAKGNIKHFEMDTTFFFEKINGTFLVVDKTNVDISEAVEQVCLTFMNGEEKVDSIILDSKSSKVTLPNVTAPQGKVLKGWAIQSKDENGNISMTITLVPGEDGTATVPSSQDLEPMVLYAVFGVEDA